MNSFAVLTIVIIGLGGWAVWLYNRLVNRRNQVQAAWSDVDVQLQRRHDLIPSLVEAVKGYAGYEKATLEAVTELRNQSQRTKGLVEKAGVEDKIEQGVHKLIALAESYPDLKADGNFLELQKELAETENHLQYARRFYNGSVRDLNTSIQSFPDFLLARQFGFGEAEFFEAQDSARKAPTVELA